MPWATRRGLRVSSDEVWAAREGWLERRAAGGWRAGEHSALRVSSSGGTEPSAF